MHPITVSIPSFRSEENTTEKGYTVSVNVIICVIILYYIYII